MTVEEYRGALEGLTPAQFASFQERWGGAAARGREACVQEFAYQKERDQWENIIVFHLRALGVSHLQTEAEKAMAFAERTADAAALSARAAARSAMSAASSSWAAWLALFVALLSFAISIAC